MKPEELKLKWYKDLIKDSQREATMDEIRLNKKEKEDGKNNLDG